MNLHSLLERILAERERGDYPSALSLAESQWEEGARDARLALHGMRAAMAAGRLNEASVWFDRGMALCRDPATDGMLRLEGAHLAVLGRMDLRRALETAESVERAARLLDLPPGDRAELRWLALRVRVVAAVLRELPPEEAARLETELTETVDALLAADRTHAALSAAFTIAERRTPPQAAAAAFEAVIGLADRHGRPGLAAEAALRRAELLRGAGASEETVEAEIRRAEERFLALDHRHGPTDCARARAELAIDHHGTPPDILEPCIRAYLDAGFPRGALSTLMDLTTHAHRRGDSEAARRFGLELARLADELGMGMQKSLVAMREADLAMRQGLHGLARDWCDAVLGGEMELPGFMRAGFLALRASALSMAGDRDGAIRDKRAALSIYESLGALDLASDLIPSLASDLAATRARPDLDAAEVLLRDWIARDRAGGNWEGTVAKLEALADLRILALTALRAGAAGGAPLGREEALQAEALAILDEATGIAEGRLSGATRAQRTAGLSQRRGTLASLARDDSGLEGALLAALERAERGGYGFEAANCRYLLGCALLNRVNETSGETLFEPFSRAERALNEALAFYEGAGGMRRFAADTRHKLALLWLNTQTRVTEPLAGMMRRAAGQMLRQAADDIDALRRAFTSGDLLEARTGKASLAGSAAQVVDQALRLHLRFAPDLAEAWRWVAGWKSRALTDLLGAEAESPETLAAELAVRPDLARLVEDERALAERLAQAPAAERLGLTARLGEVRARMQEIPALQDYLGLRTGAVADERDLSAALAGAPAPAALVDWAVLGDRLWIFVARPDTPPLGEKIPLAASRVERFVADYLSPLSFRLTLLQDPEALEDLAPLVAPLARLSTPGEHLIFCPTGALHGIPLHALPLGGEPVLVRNPVAYTPSLAILRLCRLRAQPIGGRRAVVFGDPGEDRAGANALARRLADRLGADFVLGADATAERFDRALSEAALVHFQGHAHHSRAEPLGSSLELAGGARFEARRLFAPPRIRSRTVVLGACESAAAVLETGDEQLGLIPAFLAAGARTLVAAKWRVFDASAASFMDAFYERLTAGRTPIESMRDAALALRNDPKLRAPYHWAAFALYGDPWSPFSPRYEP